MSQSFLLALRTGLPIFFFFSVSTALYGTVRLGTHERHSYFPSGGKKTSNSDLSPQAVLSLSGGLSLQFGEMTPKPHSHRVGEWNCDSNVSWLNQVTTIRGTWPDADRKSWNSFSHLSLNHGTFSLCTFVTRS